MGEKEFKKITPCISCSYGTNRFNTAQRFGRGYKNNYFVLMDCWVDKTEEGRAYKTYGICKYSSWKIWIEVVS